MTTNSPNPVDGDVQALIDICKKKISQITKEASEGLSKHKVQEMLIYSHALASLTTPPAQLLRQVELPDELTQKAASRAYGGQVEGYRDDWNACLAEVQLINATAQPVSDNTDPLLTYLKECSEQVSRWPEWKKKGSDVTALIKEMDDFELGFVNGWSERHKQPVSDGWVTVPIEPTEEMLAVGSATDGGLYCIWKDMLAAAPGGQVD